MNDNDLAKNTRTGIFWGVLQKSIHRIVSFFVFILLARLLDPQAFGLVAVARIVIDYCEMLTGQGLGLAVIQRKEINDDYLNTAFTCTFGLSLITAVLVAVGSTQLTQFLDTPDASPVLLALSASILIAGLARTQMALLTRKMEFEKLAKMQVFVSITSATIAVVMAFSGFGVWSLVAQQVSATLLDLILIWTISKWRPKFSFHFYAAKELYRFSWKILIDYHIRFGSGRVDEIVILSFLGSEILGYYSVAKKFVGVIASVFMQVISTVFVSSMSKLQDDLEKLKRFLVESLKIGALIFSPLFLGGAMILGVMIPMAFGQEWLPAVVPSQIFMALGIFMFSTNLIISAYHSMGRPQVPMYMSLLDFCVKTPILIFMAQFGTLGICAAVAISTAVVGLSYGIWLKKYISVRYTDCYFSLLQSLLLCVPMVACLHFINLWLGPLLPNYVMIALLGLAGILVYCLTLLAFKIDTSKIINVIRRREA